MKKDVAVVLWNVRSIHNVASIFRTADGAGVKKIFLCGITPRPFDRFGKVLPQFTKVSLGAEKSVEWDGSTRLTTGGSTHSTSSGQASSPRATFKLFESLKRDGYKIFAVEQSRKSVPYYRFKPFGTTQGKNQRKLALVFGNEVRGLPPSILKRADKILEIPMLGKKESLNVSVAFGIVTYHLTLVSKL